MLPSENTPAWYFIDGLNPLPWVASESSTGRRNGQLHTTFYKSEGLKAYQNGVKDEMAIRYPDVVPIPDGTPFMLEFYLKRQRELEERETRKVRRSQADATNMQKALEDALQGILYANDRDVMAVKTVIVEQGPDVEPVILIHVLPLSRRAVSAAGNRIIEEHRTSPSGQVGTDPEPGHDRSRPEEIF